LIQLKKNAARLESICNNSIKIKIKPVTPKPQVQPSPIPAPPAKPKTVDMLKSGRDTAGIPVLQKVLQCSLYIIG
jgi:hypothetical protein